MTRAALSEHPIFELARRLSNVLNIRPVIEGADEGAEDELAYIGICQYLFTPLCYPSYRIDTVVYDYGNRDCPPSMDVVEGRVVNDSTWSDGLIEIVTNVFGEALHAVLEGKGGDGVPVEPFVGSEYDPLAL